MTTCRLDAGARRVLALALPLLFAVGCQADAQSNVLIGTEGALPWSQSGPGGLSSAPDLVRCRADLLQTLAYYRDMMRTDGGRSQVDRASDLVARLAAQDMQTLAPACGQIAEWKQAAIAARDLAVGAYTASAATSSAAAASFPEAPYSGLCGSSRSSTEAVFATQVALQVARGVWSAASRACDQVAAGFNASTACIAADVALFAAEKALEDVQFCDEDIDSAEIRGTYDRVGFVHDQIVTLDAKLDLINGKLDALARAVEGLRQLGCDTVRLEHTPEGTRESAIPVCADQPGFPYAWPQR